MFDQDLKNLVQDRPVVQKPEERLIPPSQRRKRKSNQDEADTESEKENEDCPKQKKQKVFFKRNVLI